MDQVSFETGYFFGPNEIFDHEKTDVYEKLVYLYLCRCANNSTSAFPSYQTIAEKCSMSRRKAVNVIDSLVEKKLLSKTVRRGDEKNQSNLYKVLSASAHHAPPSAQHAPPLVHDMHHPSAHGAPYKELFINNQFIKNQVQEEIQESAPTDMENIESESSVMETYTKVFNQIVMPNLFSEYIRSVKKQGLEDSVISEALLEAGECSSGKPSLNFFKSIMERWIKEKIKSREEAKALRDKSKSAVQQNRAYNKPSKQEIPIVQSRTDKPPTSQEEIDRIMKQAYELAEKMSD